MSNEEKMMELMTKMYGEMQKITERLDKVDTRLEAIENTVNRIEQNEPTGVISILKIINQKLDERDSETQVLNKRVFKVESDIDRLMRQ